MEKNERIKEVIVLNANLPDVHNFLAKLRLAFEVTLGKHFLLSTDYAESETTEADVYRIVEKYGFLGLKKRILFEITDRIGEDRTIRCEVKDGRIKTDAKEVLSGYAEEFDLQVQITYFQNTMQ